MTPRISWIALTPVKALALEHVDEIELREDGLQGDRRFFLIDENNRLVNDHNGPLQLVHAEYDAGARAADIAASPTGPSSRAR